MSRLKKNRSNRRGGALLTVLWLSAALAAIAMAVATRVRAETERSATLTDGLRAKYLAEGAIQRMIVSTLVRPAPLPSAVRPNFPDGYAIVEVISEASRLNINLAPVEDLTRLLIA